MASSMASISRRLYRSLAANPNKPSIRFCSTVSSPETLHSDADSAIETDPDSKPAPDSPPSDSPRQRSVDYQTLENGLDVGIYRAILVGQVGQIPVQKKLGNGRMVTLMSVGTGGIRNNRRPLDNEEPREYANRCAVQWHRVSIYADYLGKLAMKHADPGSILYLEGNLETKIFNDARTGLVRRIREIAIRGNGRIVFLGKGDDSQQPTQAVLKGVGYF